MRRAGGYFQDDEPPPVRNIAVGCDIDYANRLDLARATVGIGLSCRLCDRPDGRSRAFPTLEHRLAPDPLTDGAARSASNGAMRRGDEWGYTKKLISQKT